MKTLYLDCSMGAAGDMLQAALFELLDDREAFLEKINNLGLEGVTVKPIPMTNNNRIYSTTIYRIAIIYYILFC